MISIISSDSINNHKEFIMAGTHNITGKRKRGSDEAMLIDQLPAQTFFSAAAKAHKETPDNKPEITLSKIDFTNELESKHFASTLKDAASLEKLSLSQTKFKITQITITRFV
jgi:hypothetical protein